jgi:protein-tyrosine-phosphatase
VHTVRVTGEPPSSEVFTVLFVCTGNICRSAFAERLGRAYLEDVLGEEAWRVRLASAGTGAVVGSGMHPDSALVLRVFGADSEGFIARQLAAPIAGEADLVLAMTRAHRRAVLQVAPRALNRTFALREAADVVALLGEVELPGTGLPERGRALVKEMAAARSRRTGGDDDVLDPINLPVEAHQEAGERVAEALVPLLARIVALHDPDGAVPRESTDDATGEPLRSPS